MSAGLCGDDLLERLESEDMHQAVLTVAEAAVYARVTEQQVRDWKRRGHLRPCDYGPRRRPLFLAIDVLRAQGAAAANTARTRNQNLATRHADPPS